MKNVKKSIVLATVIFMVLSFASCNSGGSTSSTVSKVAFDSNKAIQMVSREEGSGTRGAFIELLKIEVKNADGTKKDYTTKDAIIASSTDIVLNQVKGSNYSIGYISFGSLNDSVKAVSVDGVLPSIDTIKNNTYKVSRPFIVATNGEATGLKKDFFDFILSSQGQKIVTDNKYVKINDNATEYKSPNLTGKLVVAGSSSVTPIMEKLKEAYVAINSKVNVEIQQSDSSTGINATISGTCDIGMSSRELKDTEKLIPVKIAIDGIAVIINKNNPTANISADNIMKIYKGELKNWISIS